MRVLVTRPEPDAGETAHRLTALGHAAIVAPLLTIDFVDGETLSFDRVQAVLATSANGVRALARRTERRDVPLFAVGQQTASLARALGFRSVESANGDAAALTVLVEAHLEPGAGAVLHAAGAETEGRLAQDLTAAGYDVRHVVLYHARAASRLPENARVAIASGALDAVLHFSYRSARVFRDATTSAGLAANCAELLMVCISAAAAKSLEGFPSRELRIASSPNQDALLACLHQP